MKTWMLELAVVASVLAAVCLATHGGPVELVGSLAVLAAFAHAQVAERMREKEAAKITPDVGCHAWLTRYFVAKESLWLAYFIAHRSWSALVGVGVFLAYPIWRAWRQGRSVAIAPRPFSGLILHGLCFRFIQPPRIAVGLSWSASIWVLIESGSGRGAVIAGLAERNELVSVAFPAPGGGFWAGFARLKSLSFADDAVNPATATASFDLLGEGSLQNV